MADSNDNNAKLDNKDNQESHFPPERLPTNLHSLFPPTDQALQKAWKGPFSFVHACDPQLGLIEKYILKDDNPGWTVDVSHLKCAVKMINGIVPKPKFVVIGGDMVDTPPYADILQTHKAQYNDFKKCFDDLDPEIKLIFVCGNHDVGDMPTLATMDLYRQEFGPDFFSFWEGGVKFTVTNSQYFKFPELLEWESYQQLEFMRNCKRDDAVHHVVFQHIPLCLECEDEIDISFLNLDNPVRKEVLGLMTDAGVNHIFYGHTHRNGLSKVRSINQVLTAAVGGTFDDTKSGFRLVYVKENEITHEYIPLEVQFKEILDSKENAKSKLVEK